MNDVHQTDQPQRIEIGLIKGEHRFCIRYDAGDEANVELELCEMAKNPECPIDWFDAGTLSIQLKRG